MDNWKLSLYHKLPSSLRNSVVNLRGYYLGSWRYGAETKRLVEEAIDRDQWSAEQWKLYQENLLSEVLYRAATQVPYYKNMWEQRQRNGDKTSPSYLENWPILSKQSLRENPSAFIAQDCHSRKMFIEQTSGTTGTPLKLWWSKRVIRGWYALVEARLRRWNGVSYKENWAILGGQQIVPPHRTHPPFWVWNAPMNQLYLSANHLSTKNTHYFIQAMQNYAVTHLITYTSSATYLAQQALEQDIDPPGTLKVIITNAEPLFDWQRRILENAFRCEVRESYGMAEIVAAASERNHELHLWPEVGYVEIRDDIEDKPVDIGESGRLICTTLLNSDMPLIRYEVGDRGAWSNKQSATSQFPILSHIEGRQNDMLIGEEGRRIWWVNPIFYGLPILEAQVIQETLTNLTVRCVPTTGYDSRTEAVISQRLRDRIGDIDVRFEVVDEIPRAANGKFRAVINRVNPNSLPNQ